MHEAIIEDGTDLRDASAVIIPRLEKDLLAAMEMVTPAEKIFYEEAFLWMLYAGSLYEQGQKTKKRQPSPSAPDKPEEPWFTTTLTEHARDMHITNWEQAKVILQKFVYDKQMEPDGHLWFDEVMGKTADATRAKFLSTVRNDPVEQHEFQFLGSSEPSASTQSAAALPSSTGQSKITRGKSDALRTKHMALVPKSIGLSS